VGTRDVGRHVDYGLTAVIPLWQVLFYLFTALFSSHSLHSSSSIFFRPRLVEEFSDLSTLTSSLDDDDDVDVVCSESFRSRQALPSAATGVALGGFADPGKGDRGGHVKDRHREGSFGIKRKKTNNRRSLSNVEGAKRALPQSFFECALTESENCPSLALWTFTLLDDDLT